MDLTGVSPPPPPATPRITALILLSMARGLPPKCRFPARRSIFRGRTFMHDSLGAVVLDCTVLFLRCVGLPPTTGPTLLDYGELFVFLCSRPAPEDGE